MKTSFILATALVAVASGAACAVDTEEQLMHQGRTRSYLVHTPDSGAEPAKGRALVLVLHGGGGNAQNAMRMSGMNAVADREGFIVVYPNGSGRFGNLLLTWNAGNCCGQARDRNVDDVGFLNAVIDQVVARYGVDSRRVYMTGMSNGGMMTYRFGCESSGKVAAIAPVAGAMNIDCRPAAPLSVIAFHGTADEHVLYDGGTPVKNADRRPRVDAPVRQTIAFWTDHDGCKSYRTTTASGVTTEDWSNCAGGTEVELNSIAGLGHAWPGGQRGSRRGDDASASISASEAMWQFFSRHTR